MALIFSAFNGSHWFGGKHPDTVAQGREAERFGRRPEILLRMGLETQHRQGRISRARLRFCLRDQGAMAAMHAIEIADGHNRATAGGGHLVKMAKDAHASAPIPKFA